VKIFRRLPLGPRVLVAGVKVVLELGKVAGARVPGERGEILARVKFVRHAPRKGGANKQKEEKNHRTKKI
jgi:hypothetical protein